MAACCLLQVSLDRLASFKRDSGFLLWLHYLQFNYFLTISLKLLLMFETAMLESIINEVPNC